MQVHSLDLGNNDNEHIPTEDFLHMNTSALDLVQMNWFPLCIYFTYSRLLCGPIPDEQSPPVALFKVASFPLYHFFYGLIPTVALLEMDSSIL